jgi:hypothetical protein
MALTTREAEAETKPKKKYGGSPAPVGLAEYIREKTVWLDVGLLPCPAGSARQRLIGNHSLSKRVALDILAKSSKH